MTIIHSTFTIMSRDGVEVIPFEYDSEEVDESEIEVKREQEEEIRKQIEEDLVGLWKESVDKECNKEAGAA